MDSYDIARWADDHKADMIDSLFPEDQADSISSWDERGRSIMAHVRARAFKMLLASPAMQHNIAAALLPSLVIRCLGARAVEWLVTYIVGTANKKYQDVSEATSLEQAQSYMHKLRQELAQNNQRVTGRFTYADIVMATAVQFACSPMSVLPPSDKPRPLPCPELRAEFQDLLAWAEAVIAEHKLPRSKRSS